MKYNKTKIPYKRIVLIIIPARLKSSRFEEKILVDILGYPMVIKTALAVKELDEVVIATDSKNVIELAQEYNIKAILTSQEHQSGTDRIKEASDILSLDEDEVIINVQADEPFIEKEVVKSVIDITKKSKALLCSCYKEVGSEIADDPNLVKVILDKNNFAIYFSRSKIPYHRDHYNNTPYFAHLGIYGFKKKNLDIFCNLQGTLEHIEKLEQLRAIENGYKIEMVKVKSNSFGIDTKEDLERALKLFK